MGGDRQGEIQVHIYWLVQTHNKPRKYTQEINRGCQKAEAPDVAIERLFEFFLSLLQMCFKIYIDFIYYIL